MWSELCFNRIPAAVWRRVEGCSREAVAATQGRGAGGAKRAGGRGQASGSDVASAVSCEGGASRFADRWEVGYQEKTLARRYSQTVGPSHWKDRVALSRGRGGCQRSWLGLGEHRRSERIPRHPRSGAGQLDVGVFWVLL